VAAEGGYGSLVPFIGSSARIPERAARMLEQFVRLNAQNPDMLIVAAALAPPEFRDGLQALGYLAYEEPVNAVRAVAALAAFRRHFARVRAPAHVEAPKAELSHRGPMSEFDALAFLGAAGLPVVPARLVGTVAQA